MSRYKKKACIYCEAPIKNQKNTKYCKRCAHIVRNVKYSLKNSDMFGVKIFRRDYDKLLLRGILSDQRYWRPDIAKIADKMGKSPQRVGEMLKEFRSE